MKTPMQSWLDEYSKQSTKTRYERDFKLFTEWAKTTDVKLVDEYNAAKDKRRWAKTKGAVVLKYYNWLLEHGYNSNTARAMLSGIRAFLKSQCDAVKIRRGAIAKAKIAIGEHELSQIELRKMFHYAGVREKAILSVGVCLGWASDDFLNLTREKIEPFLEKEPFVGFWYERRKTGAITRAHLTPEAIDSLKAWLVVAPKSAYVWATNSGSRHLSNDQLNQVLKDMAKDSGVKLTGNLRFHGLRKFLMSQLGNAGLNQTHVKILVGKTVSADILTYMQGLTDTLREEYIKAYERFSLIGYQNNAKDRISELEQVVDAQRKLLIALLGVDETKLKALLDAGKLDRETFERLIAQIKPKTESDA